MQDIQFHWLPAADVQSRFDVDLPQFEVTFNHPETWTPHHFMLCATGGGRLLGSVKIYDTPDSGNIHMEFIEVAKDSRHHKVGKALVQELFREANARGKVISGNGFTALGESHLAKIADECRVRYGMGPNIAMR